MAKVYSIVVKQRRGALRMLRLCLIEKLGFFKCCNWWGITKGWQKCMVDDPDVLQFAHVHGKETKLKGAGRGSYERLKDVFDHPDCYVLLCEDHHRLYDREYDKTK